MSERTKICLAGVLTTGMGLFPVLASFGVIPTDDGDFGAPRWLVASIGQVFVLVGVWLAVSRAPDHPLTGLLRLLMAPLLLGLCALFSAAVVLWGHRVHAGHWPRGLFVALAAVFVLAMARALADVARGRRPRVA